MSRIFDAAVTRSLGSTVPASNYLLDCFVSNECAYNDVLSRSRPARGATGAYLGVGPCQNLTYIGALRPRLALIADARIDNTLEHLIFKLCAERAATPLQYLGLLFSREVPAAAPAAVMSPESLVSAFETFGVARDLQRRNADWLKQEMGRRWGMTAQLAGRVDYLYAEFCRRQLDITNVAEQTHAGLDQTARLRDVITARNSFGVNMHFLTSADRYGYVRKLHLEDKIIPILGNLTWGRTIDDINSILADAGETLATVYISNIEEHIIQRYQVMADGTVRDVNPEGLLKGEYETPYLAMVDNLMRLETDEAALLIRFFFPGEYNGRLIGSHPDLQSDVRSLRNFAREVRERKPRSVFETYF